MKTIMKTLITSALMCVATYASADSQTSTYTTGKKMLGYSMVANPFSPFEVVAGGTLVTSTNPPSDTADIEVLKIDRDNKILWSIRINGGTNEYCYNVNTYDFGGSNTGYILSGASLEGGVLRPHIWLVDQFGNLINHKYYTSGTLAGNALHAFQTQDGNILVSGFYYAGILSNNAKQGVVIKLNQTLTLVWRKFVNTTATNGSNDWDMCEFGIETSVGYFITGSRNQSTSTGGVKSVLAIWLNKTTGAISFNRSYKSSSSTANEVGASAAYDATSNKLYVLSNNSSSRGFLVTEFTIVTSPASVSVPTTNRKYNSLDPAIIDAYGYSIKIDNTNSNVLMVAGMLAGVSVTDALGNTALSKVPFIADLNITTGVRNYDRLHEIPCGGLNGFGTPFMTLGGSTSMPDIFTPEILISRKNNENYYFGYRREYNSDIRLELIRVANPTAELECSFPDVYLEFVSNNISTQSVATVANGTFATVIPPLEVLSVAFPKSQINCFEAPCVNEVANAGPDQSCPGAPIGSPALSGATYLWTASPATGITFSSTTSAQPIVLSVSGTRTVTVTMTNRCKEISTDVMIVSNIGCRLAGTADISVNQQQASVFPNPGNGTFTFSYQAEETDAVQVQILDMSGRSVAVRSLTASGQQLTFDELADGIYIYQLTVNNKVVKQDRLIINR